MILVRDLVKIIKHNAGENIIKAILPNGKEVHVGGSNYVEDNIYYMFRVQHDKDFVHTLDGLKTALECEAADSCWDPDPLEFGDGSYFVDCEVAFADCQIYEFQEGDKSDDIYAVTRISVDIASNNATVYLHCKNFSEDEEDISMNDCEEKTDLSNIKLEDLITELNHRGYSAYKTYPEMPEEPEEGFETFCVSMKVDGRVNVFVNAPIGDFQAAKDAADVEFTSNGDYDCGIVEVVDSYAVNAEDSKGRMEDF